MAGRAPLAAITGGTGFLGRYVIAALRDSGWRIRLLVRRDPTHPQLPGLDAEIVMGDLLSDAEILRRFSADADAVIHVAGAIKARDREVFFRVNEAGSAALGAAAAEAAPDARLVMISSLAAREPDLSDYAASKRAGEDAFQKTAGRPATILRPSAVHGPWDTETLVLFQLAQRRFMPVPDLPEGRLGFVYVSDVADAVRTFCTAESPLPGIFEIGDMQHQGYSWRDVSLAAADAMNRTPTLLPIPRLIWPVAGLAVETLARLTRTAPMMSRGKVREMLHPDWGTDPSRLPPRDLWQPRIGLSEGFAHTVAWARDQGVLR